MNLKEIGRRDLPGLVYIGDVPVESSYHGSALLYRLLQDYPFAKLQIVEGNLHVSQPERRLKGVFYKTLCVGRERLLRTRLHKYYGAYLTQTAGRRARRVGRLLSGFEPEAVLTVSHGYSWLTAARFAAKHQLQLHVICHDDWPRIANLPSAARTWIDDLFGLVYRQATSRLCVSPGMRDEYHRRYGVVGDVLYPFRSSDSQTYDGPPPRLKDSGRELVAAFAGTINNLDYFSSLRALSTILQDINGRLLIFGPLSLSAARDNDLERENIEVRGLLTSDELIERLRDEADILFLPMSFDPEDRPNTELSFPSKLADYTTTGLPLLIYGPEYCSAVQWSRENSGVAEVVTEKNSDTLYEALARLRNSTHRGRLGQMALRKGAEFFSYRSAQNIFLSSLARRKNALL